MNNMRNKILSLLVLLLTAASGAWAADETLLVTIENKDYADFKSGSMTIDDMVTVTFSKWVQNYGDVWGWNSEGPGSLLTVAGINGYTITSCKFYTNCGEASTGYTVEGESPSVYIYAGEVYNDDNLSVYLGYPGITKIEVYGTAPSAAPAVEVTTNEAKTEASFDMPAFDATAEYELVRDMSVQMNVKVGEEGEDGYRIRIKKDNQTGKFVPAEMTLQEMMALYTVHDGIENQDLVFYGDGKVCDISIFAVDDQDQPTGDAIAFTALTPGRYVAIATAAENSNYDGETGPSNIFELYQGYEVEIAGGEFITYYKDEAIYVEDEDVQLFSITAVGENTATATQFDVIPANKAMLVKNNSAEPKTVLLIPTETDPLSFTWYEGFVGTLEATTILASDATTDRYAFNGKQFVRVKNDLAVGANKAWLEIPAANNARIINISFEETTGIDEMVNGQSSMVNGTWYDLNGRKLDAVPTKKGVYILNGKKVVVK